MMIDDKNYLKVIAALKKLKVGMSKKKATELIMVDADLSRQTVLNAINTGIISGQIFTEDSFEGKRRSILLSIRTKIKDNEKLILTHLEDMFSDYEKKFESFTTNFKNLETDEKSDGIDTFLHFLLMADNVVSYHSMIFGKHGKWLELKTTLDKRIKKINDLAVSSQDENETRRILEFLVEQKEYDIADAFEEIEDFIEEIEED